MLTAAHLPHSPWPARLLLLATLAVAALGMGRTPDLASPSGRGEDPALYAEIVHDMRAGAGYYAVVGPRMQSHGYALGSPFNYRLPTLAMLMALLPSDGLAQGILAGLGLATLVLWYRALRPRCHLANTFMALVAMVGLLAWAVVGQAFRVHETWAGVAIALSLALFALGHGILGMLAALLALSVRELALPYLLLSLGLAFRAGQRRELYLGLLGLLFFVAGYWLHTVQISRALAISAGLPWLGLGGLGFLISTLRMNLWLLAAPAWLTALVLPISLVGLLGLPDPLGNRTRSTVYIFAALFLVLGLPFNHLWGLLYAGPALVGLAFAPKVLASLWRKSWPRSVDPG